MKNPVHYYDGSDPASDEKAGWYFWAECWAHRYGPYDSSAEASRMLRAYCEGL